MNNETECRSIYEKAFCDDDKQFENLLFCYCEKYLKTLIVEHNVVSMLFALPCLISTDDTKLNGYYVFAAATKNECQGKGYMSNLLESLKSEHKPIVLRPANNGLISFYKRLGFYDFTATNTIKSGLCVTPVDGFKQLTEKITPDTSETFTAMYFYKKPLILNKLYFPFTME